MLFQATRHPFLGTPSVVLTGSLLVALKRTSSLVLRTWDEDEDLGKRDRITAGVLSDHYRQSQPCRQSGKKWSLPSPCWRDLWQLRSAKRLSSSPHQSS